MSPLFVVLAVLGLGDLVASMLFINQYVRAALVFAAAGASAASLLALSDYAASVVVISALSGGAATFTLAWVLAADWALRTRRQATAAGDSGSGADEPVPVDEAATGDSTARAIAVLWVFVAALAAVVLTNDLWPMHTGGNLAEWTVDLPYGPSGLDAGTKLAAAAAALFLLESSNVVVRLVLQSVSVRSRQPTSPDRSIKGGRLIGPIERLLIFGLALAGEPTAAALIISAKGLLRYPEINRAASADSAVEGGPASPDPADLSEYLVLGSMVSWALALMVFATLPG